ncbi:MAG: hypothetical protein V9H26_06480 [Verrucomicrobiota bacterium]
MTLRLRNPLLLLALLVSLSVCAFGQGTFRNLDFESANVTGYSTGGVPITNALPGWTGYIGDKFEMGRSFLQHVSASVPPRFRFKARVIFHSRCKATTRCSFNLNLAAVDR